MDGKGYLAKAQEMLNLATTAFESHWYTGVVNNSILCAINSLDALTATKKGLRATGNHKEVLSLVKSLFDPKEFAALKQQFDLLIGMKNNSQYSSSLMTSVQAHNALKAACRIHDRVMSKIGQACGTSAEGLQ